MRVFNFEFFRPDFTFVDSFQIEDVGYAFDYVDIEKRSFYAPPSIKVEKGDYFRAASSDVDFSGIVVDIKTRKDKIAIFYKPFTKILDIDIMIDFDENKKVETFLKNLIEAEYVATEDVYARIPGLEVVTTSETEAEYDYDFDEGINNLFEAALFCFEVYGVVIDFKMDPGRKKITCSIGKVTDPPFFVESDLDNISSRAITIKDGRETANKLYVYNESNLTQKAVFYLDQSGGVSSDPASRILPVALKSETVKTGRKTFAKKALARAKNVLKPGKYEILIEIECPEDDLLVLPHTRKIGQDAVVLQDGAEHHTVMTGYEFKGGRAKLVFGTVRLELTKIIKKKDRRKK